MSDPRDEIKRSLEFWGLTRGWLSRRTEYSQMNLSRWLEGEVSPQDPGVWDEILKALPPIVNEAVSTYDVKRTVKLKYAGDSPAGAWSDPLSRSDTIELDAKFGGAEPAKRFVTSIFGMSLFPALQPKDLAVWHSDRNPSPGLVVLAESSEIHECTAKVLEYDPSNHRPRLMPFNPLEPEATHEHGWEVIARLVGLIRKADGAEMEWLSDDGLRPRILTRP